MIDQYAVVGNPVSHSKSPLIHAAFAAETNQALSYSTLEAPLDEFEETVRHFFESGSGKGLNVTVPFKEQAWALCDVLSERAQLAGAVNTLFIDEDGKLCGDNTDGIGLVADIKRHGVEINGARVLVIGAGGAVRGVLHPILIEGPASVHVCNRTEQKASDLAKLFAPYGEIYASGFDAVPTGFDIVINGTSASLSGELPPLAPTIFKEGCVAYDMMYGKTDTIFNQWARECGAKLIIDGLGMLVGQAAESFKIWRGVAPDVTPVLNQLRNM